MLTPTKQHRDLDILEEEKISWQNNKNTKSLVVIVLPPSLTQ